MTTERSPKGLVTITTQDVARIDREQFLAMSQAEQFALMQRLANDQKRPEMRQRIADIVATWREDATALGETDRNATASEAGTVLDRRRAAAYVHKQITSQRR
jgi:hypothetical protein